MKRSITIETVLTYIYLIVVTLTIVLLIITLKNADSRIIQNEKIYDIRATFSYIDRVLRKNDVADAIEVIKNPFDENYNAILVTKDFEYHCLFSYENNLYEVHTIDRESITIENAQILLENVNFDAYINSNNVVTYSIIDYDENDFTKHYGKYFLKTSKGA
ncbi:MAG: DUF4860 domain-containing protein [Lachnospirales bacterium]